MPELPALQALDIAIGLAFLYFLLSIVCSSIGEVIAAVFRMRAKNLETGIRTLLGSQEKADAFYANWRISSLGTPKWVNNRDKRKTSRRPSYIASRTFALTVLDTLSPKAAAAAIAKGSDQAPSKDVLDELDAALDTVENEAVKARLREAVALARTSLDSARERLEEAFDEVMDRATGWYKRKVQLVLFVVALAVAGGLNADTFNVADRLAKDDALRARVVAEAQRAAEAETPAELETVPDTRQIEDQIAQARATGIPLGWSGENAPAARLDSILGKVAGLLLTAFALTLGAPFWFDVLGKFARLRSTGNRIGTPKDDGTAPVDRDDRLQRAPSRPRLTTDAQPKQGGVHRAARS